MSTAANPGHPALSFGLAADLYDSVRPDYPEDAIDWLLPASAKAVLDLGAGTGKLTAQLVARGLNVTAVDPSEPMMSQLRKSIPSVSTALGSAESIPLADGAVDACLVAQAWHWVDPAVASEVGRVVKPGGRLGVMWNSMDIAVDWIAKFLQIVNVYDATGTDPMRNRRIANPEIGAPFTRAERFDTSWVSVLTIEAVVDLARSRSYILTMPVAERDDLLTRVREHASRSAAPDGTLELRYVTTAWRAER